MKRKRDRDRAEDRETGEGRGANAVGDGYEPDYSIISKKEREDAELVLKHGMPAFLVRELAAKGKVKIYGEPRMSLSCTVKVETLTMIRSLGEEWGLNQGRALDKIMDLVKGALKENSPGEHEETAVERSAKRRQK
jgi:hypothetical protein